MTAQVLRSIFASVRALGGHLRWQPAHDAFSVSADPLPFRERGTGRSVDQGPRRTDQEPSTKDQGRALHRYEMRANV